MPAGLCGSVVFELHAHSLSASMLMLSSYIVYHVYHLSLAFANIRYCTKYDGDSRECHQFCSAN